MLGFPGCRSLAVSQAFGELEQAIESTATGAWCAGAVPVRCCTGDAG